MRRARPDADLKATIVSRRALRYRAVAHPALDRPTTVRAGSSLAWIGSRLGMVQDDANFIAIVDPRTALVRSIALPAGEGGLRHFDDRRGNKKHKLDLEACCALDHPAGPMLLALGSGSKRRRRRLVTVHAPTTNRPRVALFDAESLYLALESVEAFAGSDLNLEGALALPDAVRLFTRGNGAAKRGLTPVNASCDLPLRALLRYLDAEGDAPLPRPRRVTQYGLGELDHLPLGFTDATLADGRLLFTAAAEASKDATEDGMVTGSVIGRLPARGDLRFARLRERDGRPSRDKVEGIVAVPGVRDRVLVVVDADDPTRASELCEVRLDGAWD